MHFSARDCAFNTAWVAAMHFKQCREWLFDRSPSLLRSALSNCNESPLLLQLSLHPTKDLEIDQPRLDFKTLLFFDHKDDDFLLCTGFNAGVSILPTLHALIPNSCYMNHQLICCRVAFIKNPSDATDLFRIEFRWYHSGVLTVWYTNDTMKVSNDPYINTSSFSRFQCRVFAPREATELRDASSCLNEFLANATSFVEHLIFDVYDTRSEGACVYCTSRKLTKCECPATFRRRHQLTTAAASTPNPVLWNENEVSLQEHAIRGVFSTSWRVRGTEDSQPTADRVMNTGISSYKLSFNTSESLNSTIQRLLRGANTSLENEKMESLSTRIGRTETAQKKLADLIGPRMWQCRECKVVIKGGRGNINAHLAHVHAPMRPFGCWYSNCQKIFQTRLNLDRHVTSVHVGRPVKCSMCSRSFKTEAGRASHVSVAHGNSGRQFKCSACGGCFGRRSTVNRHISTVHTQNHI